MNYNTLNLSYKVTLCILLLLFIESSNHYLTAQYNNIVLYEASGDGGNIEARNDAIVELAGFPGDDIGCMLITNTEWAIVLPAGTKIPADGVFLIACGNGNNGGTGAYTGTPTGLSCNVCDFPGLIPDFDVCDPRNTNYVAVSVDPNYGFTLDNTICVNNSDGDQVMLFRPNGTPHDAIYWGAPTMTGANGGTMTLGGSAGSCGSPNDHVSVQIGVPYTLGDNDNNGIINDYTGSHIGFRGDGGNSTGVKYLVSGNDDYGNPVIAGRQLTIPPGDCNADQILYTVPSLADPIWVNVGLSLPSCNSTHIRINDISPEGNSKQEIKSSTTSSHMDDPDLNMDWIDYLPNDLVPSSIDPSAAAMQWQVTNHPTPGEPNDADTWDFFIDIDNNGFDAQEEVMDKDMTSIVLCEPTSLDFQLQVFNYQHVEPTVRSANKAGTFVYDENGINQAWDLIQVGSHITETQGTMASAENGITTLQYRTNFLAVGKHEFELVWDDYTDCCGSSANSTVVNSSNPHECYETLTVKVEVVEPLTLNKNSISCPEDFLSGIINIGDLTTGGYQVLYELFLDDEDMTDPPATSNGSGIFNLPTNIAMNNITVRVSSQEPCPRTEIVTVDLNCINPPICPENFDIITGSTTDGVTLCPSEEVQLCFTGDMLPIGGQVTWTIDGTNEEVGILPIPTPICPTVIGAYINSCNVGQGEDENEYVVIRNGSTPIHAEDLSVVYTTPTRDLTETILPVTDLNAQNIVADFNADCGTRNPFQLVSTGDEIPANATILLMNGESLPDFDFDFSDPTICNSTIYIIFGEGGWRSGGTFVNNPADDRFFTASIKNNPACPGNTVAYNRNINDFDDRDGQVVIWSCNNDMIEANGIFEGDCSSNAEAGHATLLAGEQTIDCILPTNGFFSGSLGCISYTLPLNACNNSPLVFRANLSPFPDDCPLDTDDENDADAGTISINLTCPNADLVPLTTNQCVGDGEIIIMVNLSGLTEGSYCLTYLNEIGINQTINIPATPSGRTIGNIIIPDMSTNGEVDIQLVSVFTNTDGNCTSTNTGECMGTVDFDVATVQINTPPTIELIASTDLEDCDRHNDPIGEGSITFEFTGDGPFEFEYNINGGDPIAASTNTSPLVLPVSVAGTYQVLNITNEASCVGTVGNQIIQEVFTPGPIEIIEISPMIFNNCTTNGEQNRIEVDLATEISFQIDLDNDDIANEAGNYNEVNANEANGTITWYRTQALMLNDINRQELAITENDLLVAPPASQDYFFIYTHTDGCEVEGKITINVSETPDLTANTSITNVCPSATVDLTDNDLTGFMDNNEATNGTEGVISYHTIPNPINANDSTIPNPTMTITGMTYYIRKEVNGCADIVPIMVSTMTCPTCPEITTLMVNTTIVCNNETFDLTASGLSMMAMSANQQFDFGVRFLAYPSDLTPIDPYTDTNPIDLGTVTFAELSDNHSIATLNNLTLSTGTYQIVAILSPTPTLESCRPSQAINLTVNHSPELSVNPVITNTCPNTTVNLMDTDLTGLRDNNILTDNIGIISYHTIPNPADANSNLINDPTMVSTDNTYYIRKEVNGCVDIVAIVVNISSCINCPIIGDVMLSDTSICSDGLFDLTITTLNDFAQVDNHLQDFGIQVITYPLGVTPIDPYTDANVITLATIPFENLQDSTSLTIKNISSNFSVGNYSLYVLLHPRPTDLTCHPLQVENLTIRPRPEEINLPFMICNDQINVSLNEQCQLELDLDFFLENPTLNDNLTYALVLDNSPDTLFFGNGNIPLNSSSSLENVALGLTGYQMLTCLEYLDCDGVPIKIQDKCWGNILVEDKRAPICHPQGDIEPGLPLDLNCDGVIDLITESFSADPSGVDDLEDEYIICSLVDANGIEPYFDILEIGEAIEGNNFGTTGDFFDCTGIQSVYYEDSITDICEAADLNGFPINFTAFNGHQFSISQVYQRTWHAIDINGMRSSQGCSQYVFVLKPKVILLESVVVTNCSDTLKNIGAPFFTVANDPVTGIIYGGQGSGSFNFAPIDTFQLKTGTVNCNYTTSFSTDPAIPTCGNSYKQFRHWTVSDWCNGTRLYDEFTQTLKVVDNNLPSIRLADTKNALPLMDTPKEIELGVDTIFNTQIFECFATGQLPEFEVIDSCNAAQIENIRIEQTNLDFNLQIIQENYNIGGNLDELNLPIGTYIATYTFADACNNHSEYELFFAVVDQRLPVPICNDELNVSLIIDRVTGNQQARVYAEDFDDTSFDNCSELTYEIRSINNANPDDDDWSEYVEFTCADVGGVKVELRITDANGYYNDCWGIIQLHSPNTFYTCAEALCHIGGTIRTESGMEVENVQLQMMIQTDTIRTVATNVLGKYRAVNLYAQNDYQVIPSKDAQPLNGVSTMDLIQIRKHLLGQEYLTSPYQMIAADVNHSGSISTMDLIELRRVILQFDSTFMHNTSWCFIPAEYEFPNPSNPWETEIPMSAIINDVPSGNVTVDFIAIKIGDVNGSVIPNAPIQTNEANLLQQANDSVINRIAADEIQLMQNQPNPFTNQTSIRFYLPNSEQIRLSIFTLTGKKIILWNEKLTAGYHTYQLSATALSTHGVYCYALETETTQILKKMVRLK